MSDPLNLIVSAIILGSIGLLIVWDRRQWKRETRQAEQEEREE